MEREARAAASLTHPGLVTVYDFGRDEAGPFLVMEMVEGPTLEQLGEATPVEAIDIGAQLADALAAIHAAGIVHRDVKPANVIMSSRGPLLTDFGIALSPDAAAKLTEPGKVVGTPSYAAPEVLRGEPPTAASDVYSLAKVIEQLVSGGEPETHEVLADALGASPDDRPSAEAFAAQLRGAAPTLTTAVVGGSTLVLDALPSSTAPVGLEPEGRRTGGVSWSALALGALAVVAVLVGVALADGEPEGSTSTTAAAAPVTTTVTTATTVPSATTEVGGGDPTGSGPESVEELRTELESILLAAPRSDLKRREIDEVLELIDQAIAGAEEGNRQQSAESLGEAYRRLEEKLDDETLARAGAVVERLADRLDVTIDGGGDEDGDDD